jgi:hypothetical protein
MRVTAEDMPPRPILRAELAGNPNSGRLAEDLGHVLPFAAAVEEPPLVRVRSR